MTKEQISHMKLWLKALRSGEFEQTKNQLRNGSKREFCCLGVACEVYRKATGDGLWRKGVFIIDEAGEFSALPNTVRIWLGLDRSNPVLGTTSTAASLNDDGVSFYEIADRLERRFLA